MEALAALQAKNPAAWEKAGQDLQTRLVSLLASLPGELQGQVDAGVAAAVVINCGSLADCKPLLQRLVSSGLKGSVMGVAGRLVGACTVQDQQSAKMFRQQLSACAAKEPELLASFCHNVCIKLAADVLLRCLMSLTAFQEETVALAAFPEMQVSSELFKKISAQPAPDSEATILSLVQGMLESARQARSGSPSYHYLRGVLWRRRPGAAGPKVTASRVLFEYLTSAALSSHQFTVPVTGYWSTQTVRPRHPAWKDGAITHRD